MNSLLSNREKALLGLWMLWMGAACFLPAWQQSPDYHAFADQRSLWGLNRAMDVLSNLPFAVMGAWGLTALWCQSPNAWPQASRQLAALFFVGLIITAVGSAWYHHVPDDARLLADRSAMVLSFSGLMALAASERVSLRAGLGLAGVALAGGALSLWVWTHHGNLTPWAVFQGGGMVLVLGLLVIRPVSSPLGVSWGTVVGVYALAKVAEGLDARIFDWTGYVSGHSLKHGLAALAAWPVIRALRAARDD
jgi:hypothetical protein